MDLDAMRQCLAEGHPIVFGLKLTSQFFKPSRGGGSARHMGVGDVGGPLAYSS